tara:strand:- start:4325 stop:4570 length:246 start_codon:yes stop_codon:yes gene_type:complete
MYMTVNWQKVLEDTMDFLNALPDELCDLTENIQRDRPDLYEKRLDLISMNLRNSVIALQVVWEQLDGEEKAVLDMLIGKNR